MHLVLKPASEEDLIKWYCSGWLAEISKGIIRGNGERSLWIKMKVFKNQTNKQTHTCCSSCSISMLFMMLTHFPFPRVQDIP